MFVCSNVGENYVFLKRSGLSELAFNRDDQANIDKAIHFAMQNYMQIKQKLKTISKEYEWDSILNKNVVEIIYG